MAKKQDFVDDALDVMKELLKAAAITFLKWLFQRMTGSAQEAGSNGDSPTKKV